MFVFAIKHTSKGTCAPKVCFNWKVPHKVFVGATSPGGLCDSLWHPLQDRGLNTCPLTHPVLLIVCFPWALLSLIPTAAANIAQCLILNPTAGKYAPVVRDTRKNRWLHISRYVCKLYSLLTPSFTFLPLNGSYLATKSFCISHLPEAATQQSPTDTISQSWP